MPQFYIGHNGHFKKMVEILSPKVGDALVCQHVHTKSMNFYFHMTKNIVIPAQNLQSSLDFPLEQPSGVMCLFKIPASGPPQIGVRASPEKNLVESRERIWIHSSPSRWLLPQ